MDLSPTRGIDNDPSRADAGVLVKVLTPSLTDEAALLVARSALDMPKLEKAISQCTGLGRHLPTSRAPPTRTSILQLGSLRCQSTRRRPP